MGDDDDAVRNTAPKGPEDWQRVWRAVVKAEAAWIVVSPFVAVARNWKAWLIIGGVVLFVTSPELRQAIAILTSRGEQ